MVEARENGNSNTTTSEKKIAVHVFGRTDVGMVREHNEDNFLIADLSSRNRSIQPEVQQHEIGELGSVFAVCDGMGGAAAGEVASKLGVDTIYEVLQEGTVPADDTELAFRLNDAVCEAGKSIYAESKANSSRRGMGTTATVAILRGERLFFGQVGDSRAHIIRNGNLVQTTKDQSLVQQLIDANQLTPEEARNFDRSNIILQALGTSEEVHVDVTSTVLKKGDCLVICSDGLSGMVEPEDIRDVVLAIEDPIKACKKLTQMACDNGGDDNITVIVARFSGDALQAPTADDVVKYEKFILPGIDDDESVTIPKGMPLVPGSAARTAVASKVVEGQSSGKLPFLILLSILALGGLIIGFAWKGKPAGRGTSQLVTEGVSGVDSDISDIPVKPPLMASPIEVVDVDGTAGVPGMDSGDVDSSADEMAMTDTSNVNDVESERLVEGEESDLAPVASSNKAADAIANQENKRLDDIDTSQVDKSATGQLKKNAGKWAHGKQARKRKSAQESTDDDTDVQTSEDSSAEVEKTSKVDEVVDTGTAESGGKDLTSETDSEPRVAIDRVRKSNGTAPPPSDADENPY